MPRPLSASMRGRLVILAGLLVSLWSSGCRESFPTGGMAVTQVPTGIPTAGGAEDLLDLRYPPGSRVVLVQPPFTSGSEQVLSAGLSAAGGPVASADGTRILFAGKAKAGGSWQIYEAQPGGKPARLLTAVAGGAMEPALLAGGELVFCSPVPNAANPWRPEKPAALYRQGPGGRVERLTFGASPAMDPTVLRDGKILFTSVRASSLGEERPRLGLFTINNDGTEFTHFALEDHGAPLVRRPRESLSGTVAFLAAGTNQARPKYAAEGVRMAKPFASRTPLFEFLVERCHSLEEDREGSWLACIDAGASGKPEVRGSSAVYRIPPGSKVLGIPLFDNPEWDEVEAVPLMPKAALMGHLSTLMPEKSTGTILCLNAFFSRPEAANSTAASKIHRIRILAQAGANQLVALGEITPQTDGSFLVTVPAEVPLGFEALDDQDQVIQRLPPSIWVRRGENRSCLGCHEPHNRSPQNIRPIAAGLPPVNLGDLKKASLPVAPEYR